MGAAAHVVMASAIENPQPAEQVRVAWKVKANLGPGEPEVTCVVTDVSTGGARLSVPRDIHLPDHFSLFLPLKNETHQVEVKWRDHETSEVGVAFLAGAGTPSSEAHSEVRVAQLEAHIQHLEEQIHRMDERLTAVMERVTRLEFR
jgi:hypothetical protein